MADKTIGELTEALQINDNDLFVLEQGSTAKKLPGSTLKNYVVLDVVSAEAQTLPAGSDATANYDKANKTLQIGVPTGLTGSTGPAGADGKSAYQSAVEAGYSGTETAFNAAMSKVPGHIADGDIHVTAEEKEAWSGKASTEYVDNAIQTAIGDAIGGGY